MKYKISLKTVYVIGGFILYSWFMYNNYEEIARFMGSQTNVLISIATYIIFNPAYLLIIYGIWNRFKGRVQWKRITASILSILSLDFLSLPRLAITDSLIDGPAITTNIGSVIMKALETFLPHNVSYLLMYLILPIIGLTIAVELLGITNFIRERTKL